MTVQRKPQAAIYVRLSSYRETDSSLSPETQRRTCEEYAAARGLEVTGIYEDLDVSGGSLARPQLDRLRQEWRNYDYVIATKIDRISRSVRDFDTLNREAQAAGVALVAVRDNLDMSTAFGRFVAVIIAAFAEMELAIISERMLQGKATSRALGRWQGGRVPFGFTTTKPDEGGTVLVMDDAEAALIREAAEKKLDGASWGELCNWFQATIPPRISQTWNRRSVRRAISHERLRGTVFTAAEYETVLKACAPMKREEWTPNAPRILSGLLRCWKCGRTLHRQPRPNGRNGYQCQTVTCNGVNISAERLEEYVEAEFLAAVGPRQETRARAVADLNDEAAAELEAELRGLNESLAALDDDALSAAIGRRKEINAELARLRALPRGPLVLTSTGRTYAEAWAETDVAGRRRLIRDHLDVPQITVGPATDRSNWFDPERLAPLPLFPVD